MYFLFLIFTVAFNNWLFVLLQGSENEVLLKEVLYNSVMMIDYSFINPQAEFSLYANSLKDFAITWLFVAELAVQSARYEKKTVYCVAVIDEGVSTF